MKRYIPAAAGIIALFLITCLAGEGIRAGARPSKPARQAQNLEFVDTHSHIFGPNQNIEQIVGFMAKFNVKKMVLSGFSPAGQSPAADLLVKNAAAKYPGKFILFLRGFNMNDKKSPEYVRKQLAGGAFKGIGELIIYGHGTRVKGDNPVLMEIYKTAGTYNAPVLFHWTIGSASKKEPGDADSVARLENALGGNKNTTFILAHCGAGPAPYRKDYEQLLESLLSKYPNLYMDIAYIPKQELYDSKNRLMPIGPIVLKAIKKYPGRFFTGFDLGASFSPYAKASENVNYYRMLLANLPADVAKKVASENAKRVFAAQFK